MESELTSKVQEVEVRRKVDSRTPRFMSRAVRVYTENSGAVPDDVMPQEAPYGAASKIIEYLKGFFLPHAKVNVKISVSEGKRKVYA